MIGQALPAVSSGPFRLDPESRTLLRSDKIVSKRFQPKEYRIFVAILARNGRVAEYSEFKDDPEIVYRYGQRIKDKLFPDVQEHLIVVRGTGFRFDSGAHAVTHDLSGRQIHIAGSAGAKENLQFVHNFVSALTERIFAKGAGFVVSAGGEHYVKGQTTLCESFDWTVLETVDKLLPGDHWNGIGSRIVNVHTDDISARRVDLWQKFLDSDQVDEVKPPHTGCESHEIQSEQARRADILIIVGGRVGAEVLAWKYQEQGKHVIPLDLDVGESDGPDFRFALTLRRQILEQHCRGWIRLRDDSTYSPTALLQAATSDGCRPGTEDIYADRVLNLLVELQPPQCLFLGPPGRTSSFESRMWFEQVASPVMQEFGMEMTYQQVDGCQPQRFAGLAFVVVDLSGLREQSLMHAGAAIGADVNHLFVSDYGTEVPFASVVFRREPETTNIHRERERFATFVRRQFARD